MGAKEPGERPWAGFTLVEVVVSLAILALVMAAFAEGFQICRSRQESSSLRTDMRVLGSFALEVLAKELETSAPGYVDTVQRGPTATVSDVFEDPLGRNCTSPTCPALSSTGASSLPSPPGSWLGLDPTGSPTGIAWAPLALGKGFSVCPFDGASLTNKAYTDALLFLTPADDRGAPKASTDSASPRWWSVVVYAPYVDANGRGSLRRYSLSWTQISDPGSVAATNSQATLQACLDPTGRGVLFQAYPLAYDMGSAADNVFQLMNDPVTGQPAIVWQKGAVLIAFDRASGRARWNVAATIGGAAFASTGAVDRPIRTLASAPGCSCIDFAATSFYSDPTPGAPDHVSDQRRVRLAIAMGGTRAASTGYAREGLVAVSGLEVTVRNSP